MSQTYAVLQQYSVTQGPIRINLLKQTASLDAADLDCGPIVVLGRSMMNVGDGIGLLVWPPIPRRLSYFNPSINVCIKSAIDFNLASLVVSI